MANVVTGQLGEIGGKLIMNIVYGLGVVVFGVVLWFGSRYFQSRSRKNKKFTQTSVIVDKVGNIKTSPIGTFRDDKTGLIEMQFKKKGLGALPPIPKECFVDDICILYNYSESQYSPVHPTSWKYILDPDFPFNPKKLKLINIGMKEFLFLRQRNILNKVEAKKMNLLTKLPWITMGSAVGLAIITIALSIVLGQKGYAENIAQRMIECKEVLKW